MVDYLAWGSADPITVEQAAHLWAGVEPPLLGFSYSVEDRLSVAPRLQMLKSAVSTKELLVHPAPSPYEDIDDFFMGCHLVRRDDLIAFAIKRKERPAFLFDTMLSEVPKAPASQPDQPTPPKNTGGRPPLYDWNRFFLEIIRIADLDGLPATQAELANRMRDWFISEIDDHPADTTLEERIRPIYRYFENARKPPAG